MSLFTSLRYLVALHQQKHFGRAALASHITQPALSNAIRALEQEFGTPIVKRGRSFEGFTPEGERIFVAAQRMLHEQELLLQDLKSAADRPVGALTIGAVPSVMPIAARFTGLLQAQHPGMTVVLRSMSSSDVEAGLEDLSLDLALGYTERIKSRAAKIATLDQYVERYFLLRRAPAPGRSGLALLTQPVTWLEASRQPLCMLTAEMHNRSIVDSALRQAGAVAKPAIETNSILTLGLSVLVGKVNSILPGALVGVLRGYAELEAVPLADPQLLTPIGFMYSANERASHTLKAALAMAQTSPWQEQLRLHAGLLRDDKAATKG